MNQYYNRQKINKKSETKRKQQDMNVFLPRIN